MKQIGLNVGSIQIETNLFSINPFHFKQVWEDNATTFSFEKEQFHLEW